MREFDKTQTKSLELEVPRRMVHVTVTIKNKPDILTIIDEKSIARLQEKYADSWTDILYMMIFRGEGVNVTQRNLTIYAALIPNGELEATFEGFNDDELYQFANSWININNKNSKKKNPEPKPDAKAITRKIKLLNQMLAQPLNQQEREYYEAQLQKLTTNIPTKKNPSSNFNLYARTYAIYIWFDVFNKAFISSNDTDSFAALMIGDAFSGGLLESLEKDIDSLCNINEFHLAKLKKDVTKNDTNVNIYGKEGIIQHDIANDMSIRRISKYLVEYGIDLQFQNTTIFIPLTWIDMCSDRIEKSLKYLRRIKENTDKKKNPTIIEFDEVP